MSRSSFGFRRSFNTGRKLSRENRKDIPGQARSEHNDMHEKRQRSRHDNSDADKATRSIFGDVPLTDTERRFLWAAQSGNLPALEVLVEEAGTFNLSCRDYLGRTALQLAVLGEHYDCIQLLLEKSRLDVIEEGLLHAIKTENVKICDMFLAHPVYSDQRSRMQLEFQHGFYEQEDSSSSFAPDITPIVLAAQCNNFDIVHMLIQKGFTIPTPHNYFCLCTECYNHKNFDRVVHSKSRLNAYRGLASTAYLALSCDDPIYAAFELSRSLQKLAEREKEHKSEYRGLSDKCKNFAVDLLDQCRTNEEVMAALHGGTNTRDLSRIKMAIRYEQKKFIAHASCQEHLASMWYAGASWFQHQNFPIKLVMVPLGIIFIPVTAIVYVFLPYSRIGKILKSPFMKFMNYICSYTAFLVLLFLGTQLSSFKSVHLFNGIEGVVNSLIMFYVLGMFWAECKQLWEEGVKGYFSQMWNYMDITMLALYTAGYSTEGVIYTKANGLYTDNHLIHSQVLALSSDQSSLAYSPSFWHCPLIKFDESILNPQILSKVLFSVANVMSFARIAYILPASETFGQLQISYGRMLQDVGKFIFIYFTVMIAFICGLTSLYSISKNENFAGLMETTGTLFWAAFGMGNSQAPAIKEEPPAETSLGEDGEITDSELLQVVEMVGYILYGVYILGAVVVLINMLIAMMSNTFEDIQKSEDSEWKFARAKLWISFIEQGTTLPIPFNIIPTPKSILRLFRWFRDCVCCEVVGNEWSKEDGKQYEREYKAIMHRVVLRYIHKMKFEKKGESLKDEILDTREEVIFQLHSMYGRLAARLELLEKDVFIMSKHGWVYRDAVGSPNHSSLSYSRSVPSHPGNDSARNSTTEQPRESFLYRRRSYYHERPKRELHEGSGRLSLEERLRKYSGDDADPRRFQSSLNNISGHFDAETNMSDGDKRNRKVSGSLTPVTSPSFGALVTSAGTTTATTAKIQKSADPVRKESGGSGVSQGTEADDYSLGRRDSFRTRPPLDGAFSPRPGGDRHARDDSLRGSRKGYNSSPRWNQGVIKESSLEDQISGSSEQETSFGAKSDNFLHNASGNKRRETHNHPNIDAPFGLPLGETGPRTTSFTEYHEPKAKRRDTIQSLVLDVHQIPFTKLEGCQPSSASPLPAHPFANPQGLDSLLLSPTDEDTSETRRSWSRSSTPRSADCPVTTRTFNFPSHPARHTSASGQPGVNTTTESHNSGGGVGNADVESEDQYAAKLCNASHNQSQIYSRYYGRPLCVAKISQSNTSLQKSDGVDVDRQATRSDGTLMDPLDLVESSASFKTGRKLGHVNHVYVPDLTSRQRSLDPRIRDLQKTSTASQTKTSKPNDDPIFYTKVPLETNALFSEAPIYPTAVTYRSHNESGHRHSTTESGRDQVNDQSSKDHPSQYSRNTSNYFPLAKPEVFTADNEPATQTQSTSTDREHFIPSLGFLSSATVKEEDEYYTDRQQDMNSYLEPSNEELDIVRNFSETAVHTSSARTMFTKKRESLPVSSSSKHQRMIHTSRDPRQRYGSNTPHQDYYPPSMGASVSRFQHYPYAVDLDSMSSNLASPDYEVAPMIIPPMATNLSPFPFPTQPNDVFVQRPQMSSEVEHGGSSSGNERETPKRKSSSGKKPSLVSLVRGRRSDKVKGKLSEVKHNRSLSLNRSSGGSRKERMKTLQTQRSKEV